MLAAGPRMRIHNEAATAVCFNFSPVCLKQGLVSPKLVSELNM